MLHDIRVDRLEDDPRVAVVTLDRPERRNAYTQRLCDELCAALTDLDADPDVRAVVLTGAGSAFCSGGDVRSEEETERGDGHPFGHGDVMRATGHRVVLTLRSMRTPVVAAVNGAAVAGGLTFALACDLRVAAASARLGDTAIRFGLLPDEGGAWFFPEVLGLEAALRMSLLGEVYDAETALRKGLVGEVVPDAELMQVTGDLASRLADAAPLAVATTKHVMRRSSALGLEGTLDALAAAVDVVNRSDDVREGVAAFTERRTPRFSGR